MLSVFVPSHPLSLFPLFFPPLPLCSILLFTPKCLSTTLPYLFWNLSFLVFTTPHYHCSFNLVFLSLPLPPVLSPEVPVSSVLCLSSVRELPIQVRELYAQGFVLVAVHPFVHPCGPRHAHIQRQLHRAVLVRETSRYAKLNVPLVFSITVAEDKWDDEIAARFWRRVGK